MSWLALTSERWQSKLHVAWPRRTQALLFVGLVTAFVIFRWIERREPWNSDDMSLFAFSVDAAAGEHWVFGSPAVRASSTEAQIPDTVHTAFRIGVLPLSVPAVKLLGASAAAYFLVPLLFSLLGFVALYWVMLTHFGPLVALVFGVIHIAWPFELEHASLFLTDTPAAATGLVSFCLLDASARREHRGRIACAVLAGLAAWETYLLRNNGLVLLAPAFLVLLWCRSTRAQTLWAIGVALLGVLGQQAFLAYRGFGWWYDWSSVRHDFAEYAPFLPVYSWGTFLVRQFMYQVSTFGHGLTGALAALLVLGSLALHVLLLRFERRVLLLAIAVFGLSSWLVFSFSIYELVPGGVRATVPVNFRFVQPFTYSSLVVWAWAWCSLRERLAAAGWISSAPATPRTALRQRLAILALPALLITFSFMACVVRAPKTYRRGQTHRVAQAIERAAQGQDALMIAGTEGSLRVPRVFCSDTVGRVEWRVLSLSELGELVEQGGQGLILRDIPRELTLARYRLPEERQAYRDELARIEETLWRDYELAYVDATYALFRPPSPGTPLALHTSGNDWTVPSTQLAGASMNSETACRVLPDGQDASMTLVPSREGGSRASCEHTWQADPRARLASAPPGAKADDSAFVLRLHADYEVPLSLSVDVVQHTERGVRRQRAQLPPGTSYVPLRLEAGAQSLSLVYRIRTRSAAEGQVVRIRPAEWRPHQPSTP